MSAPYRPMTAKRGDPVPLRRILACVQLFTREGPWAWWITFEAFAFWSHMNRFHADRNSQLLDMHKDWGDWDHALIATVPLIASLAELSDRLGDDARVRRLLRDLARLDGPALSTLADRLHERVANSRRAA